METDLAGKKKSTRDSLQARIFRAIRYLEARMDNPPSIDELARQAGMSKFHFQRTFRSVIGESVTQHMRRLRIERGASFLTYSNWLIGEIALMCGFKTQASFGREFKKIYGMTPMQWRSNRSYIPFLRGNYRNTSADSAGEKETGPLPTVHFEHWPEEQAICSRHYVKIEDIPMAWRDLVSWARANLEQPEKARYLGLWFDDWSTVDEENYRYECAIIPAESIPETIPEPFFVRTLAASHVAVTVTRGSVHQLDDTWRRFGGGWLPFSGYQPAADYGLDEYPASLTLATPARQLLQLAAGISVRLCLPVQKEPVIY